jgi:hypothetical protein
MWSRRSIPSLARNLIVPAATAFLLILLFSLGGRTSTPSAADPPLDSLLQELHEILPIRYRWLDRFTPNIIRRPPIAQSLANRVELNVPVQELLPDITSLLSHRLRTVKVAALELIKDIGPPAYPCLDAVRPLLSHQDTRVQAAAITALQSIQSSATHRPTK